MKVIQNLLLSSKVTIGLICPLPLIVFSEKLMTLYIFLDFPRINILAMAKSLTEPELKQYNTTELLDTKS
jgi:hypothetical protein